MNEYMCSYVSLGGEISKTSCCSMSPLSTALMNPKEQQRRYSLEQSEWQDLPERNLEQLLNFLVLPNSGLLSRFISEAVSMNRYRGKAALSVRITGFLIL